MIRDSSDFAKVALTIAIRYSCIRKQFPSPSSIGQKKGALQYLKRYIYIYEFSQNFLVINHFNNYLFNSLKWE